MHPFDDAGPSRRTLLRGLGGALALPLFATATGQALAQLDPDDREYVLQKFTIDSNSLDVLVAKTASKEFAAGNEYWSVNSQMLSAIAGATRGKTMTIAGTSGVWPAPKGFLSSFRMQDAVAWTRTPAPTGLCWAYSDERANNPVCIAFRVAEGKITAIEWYLAATSTPPQGTFVFAPGPSYALAYTTAPTLATGYGWFGATVYPEA